MEVNRRAFVAGTGAAATLTMPEGVTATTAQKPNVIIFITDHTFADALSFRIGSRYLHTPAIDRIAAQGMAFTNAYCANPICVPSRTSMFTGRFPVETKIQENGGAEGPEPGPGRPPNAAAQAAAARQPARLDPNKFPTLGTVFRRAGYDTVYSGKWHVPIPQDEASGGFRLLYGSAGDSRAVLAAQAQREGRGSTAGRAGGPPAPGAAGFNQEKDEPTTIAAMNYLRTRQGTDPWMMVVSFLNPHDICQWARDQDLPTDGPIGDPPRPEFCPPLRANSKPQLNEPDIVTLMRKSYQATPTFPVGNFDQGKWRQYLWAYYRLLEKVDRRIDEVLTALYETGQANNTIVVFTSDHGDCQGSHLWNQKTILYEEAARVPFVIAWPGKIKRGTSSRLVHTGVDMMPTLCDLANVPLPANMPGLSLKKTALGMEAKDPREFVVVSDRLAQGLKSDPVPDGRMLRAQRYKYTVYSHGVHRESLVDLQKDPGETVNLAGDPAFRGTLVKHRTMLAQWCAEHGDDFPIPT